MPGNSYENLSGTSMACPHVSGVAALIVSKFAGNITPQQVWERLVSSADQPGSLASGSGSGRLNAANALQDTQENDGIAPNAVTDLQVTETIMGGLSLGWTAPADAGNGKASYYIMCYATAPITEANFNQASQVQGLPRAASAGTYQSFTLTGLQPTTTYYVALKSADIFGNLSDISNLATGTTASAPAISVSPGSLQVEIDASANPISMHPLRIANTGSGAALEFRLNSYYDGWLVSYAPAYGSVEAGGYVDANVTFNASQLSNGQHSFELMVYSNDPNTPYINIPVNVTITGNGPKIVIDNRDLQFENTFVGGNQNQYLVVRNEGMEYLYIHEISSSNPAFYSYSSGTWVYPGGDAYIAVSFSPTELGEQQGTLSLHSNDPSQPHIEVAMTGTATEPPVMSVSPGSFELEIDVTANPHASRTLNIANNGAAALHYNLQSYYGESTISYTPAHGTLNAGEITEVEVGINAGQLTNGQHQFYLTITSNDPINQYFTLPISVLVSGQKPVMAIETLELNFDSVYVGGRSSLFLEVKNLGGEYLILDDISSTNPAFTAETNHLLVDPNASGYFQVHFTPSETGSSQGTLTLNSNDADQPQLQITLAGLGLAAPAIRISPADNMVVEIDAATDPIASRTLIISNDGASSLNFMLQSYWYNPAISFAPASGSLQAGDSTEVVVTFDASGLRNGHHDFFINITSNDPVNPGFYLYASVTVSGHGSGLEITPSNLAFDSVFVGIEARKPLVIRNKGFDYLYIHEISTNDPFYVNEGAVFLYPQEERTLWVSFFPTEKGSSQGSLDFFIDDPNQPHVTVTLSGTSVAPPTISAYPNPLSAVLESGETGSKTLTIVNTGDSPLHYSFPAFVVQNLLKDPLIQKNNTTPVAVPAEYKDREKGSTAAEPTGHPVVLGAGSDYAFGYTWIDSDMPGGPEFVWEDIAANGTEILHGVDDGSVEISLPFSFEFYGQAKNSIQISSNGFLTFGWDGYTYSNSPIPSEWGPNDLIAPFWDDLLIANNESHVYYTISPEALIVQYEKVRLFYGSGHATFQVKVLANGNIYFYYKQMSTLDIRNSATIGLENAAGTDGLQVVFNQEYVKDNLAVMMMPPGPGFITGVSHPAGTVQPYGSQEVEASIAAGELGAGVHRNILMINSNDPYHTSLAVPFELTIGGTPKIYVTDSVFFGQVYIMEEYPSYSEGYLSVQNLGTKALVLSAVYVLDSTAFSVNFSDPQVVKPNETTYVPVKFWPRTAGTFSTQLVFESNDPTDSLIMVTVWGTGVYPPIFDATTTQDVVMAKLRSDELKGGTIQISNTGGSIAHYKAFVMNKTAPETTGSTLAAENQFAAARRQTTAAPANATLSVLSQSQLRASFSQVPGSNAIFTDSLYYENSNYADGSFGVTDPNVPFGIATKFVSPADGFTLTHVHNFYKGSDIQQPAYLVIYKGDSSIATATPVHWQAAWATSEAADFQLIPLDNPQTFEGKQTFWVVFHYWGSRFEQGYNNDLNAPGGVFSYTFDFGNSWTPLEHSLPAVVPKVRALQSTSKWITLEPAEGELEAGASAEMQIKMNATMVAGGDYYANIQFNTNDPLRPQLTIPLQVHVNSRPQFQEHASSLAVNENETLQLVLKATDADGGMLQYSLLEHYPNVSFQSTAEGALITFRPDYSQSGEYNFTVAVMDDMQEKTSTSFVVKVLDVNRPPVVVSQIKSQSVKKGASLTLNLSGIFTDPDNDQLAFTASATKPALVKLVVSGNTLIITGLEPGTTIVSLLANDGKGGIAGTSFEVKVSGDKNGGKAKREADDSTADEEVLSIPLTNYPNPFRGETTIAYTLQQESHVKLQVLTIQGVPVNTLMDQVQEPGKHSLSFDAGLLPAGVYLYRLQVADQVITRRMIIR